jgi:hypothetical protein
VTVASVIRNRIRQPVKRLLPSLAGALALGLSLVPPGSAPAPKRWVGLPPAEQASWNGADPLQFTPEELADLRRRFGVHGPQPRLAQLFSEGIDQLQPLRTHALGRLEELRPLILSECARQKVNPLLVTAVLFDEMRHAKPGEDHPMAAHSGLFSTHGPAQLGIGELVHQGLLPAEPTPEQISWARDQLLDPSRNVILLIGKFNRLKRELGIPSDRILEASRGSRDAKSLAILAYLHNGKLDYPRRILASMQDPDLHALVYGERRAEISPLI